MRARRIGLPCVGPPPHPLRKFTLEIELRPWPDPNCFPRFHLFRWWR